MKVVIRTDASILIGSGHIMRCLVLAEALKEQGDMVSFASRPQKGDLIEFVRKKGFKVYELVTPTHWQTPRNSADYAAWLQVPWQKDVESLIQQVDNIDLLIVDHYGLNADWELFAKNKLKCKLFAIDDLVRKHRSDLILDQTLLRNPSEYKAINPNSVILAGCDFTLLKHNFITYREKALETTMSSSGVNVLISMGGVDQPNATLQVLQALAKIPGKKPLVTVLLSAKAPNYQSVKIFSLQHSSWVDHVDFVENMAELMLSHHVAIGAPGGASWERAYLGIPSVIIPLADNQQTISANLVQVGAAISVNIANISSDLLPAYQTMINEWSSMRIANLSICDGLGIFRVTQSINALCSNASNLMTLRCANKSDIEQVFDLQLLPETRKYALTPELPTWEGHQKWMNTKLKSISDYFYIIETLLNNKSIGVLRLDKLSANKYILSIFIDPQYFGQGFAKQALAYVDRMHPNITIQATVSEENIASQRLFSAAHYQRLTVDTFIRSPIY
jgi:UDP-2,4-diacetamido-2,4,6-trideoxy-beta-L-altropyranose hydrolase